jgi:hypothetical protein
MHNTYWKQNHQSIVKMINYRVDEENNLFDYEISVLPGYDSNANNE